MFLLLVFALAQAVLFVGAAWALGVSFSDGFGSFDTARWSKGNHTLGRSYLYPANVSVDGENLRIAFRPVPWRGARSSPTSCTVTVPTRPA